MRIKILILCFCVLSLTLEAQRLTTAARFSVLTCSPGTELYSAFGHSAIRFSDSLDGNWVDVVFNYGTFEFSDDFYYKFAKGRLNYMLDIQEFSMFYRQYILSGRGIIENELVLTIQEKQRLFDLLIENSKDENKYFRYDFFYDNCSTRIRDILRKAFPEIQLSTTDIQRPSFRKTIDIYLTKLGWADFGIDLVLGTPCDRVPGDREIEFLPDSMHKSMKTWSLNGRKLFGPSEEILPFDESQMNVNERGEIMREKAVSNQAKKWMWILGLFFGGFAGFQWWKMKKQVGVLVLDRVYIFLLGFLGFALLLMWFATDHAATKWNFNLLWANPGLLLLAFHNTQKIRAWVSTFIYVQLFSVCYCLIASIFPPLCPQLFNTAILPLLVAEIIILLRLALIRRKLLSNSYL